jgi:hypothetical protein
MSTSLATLASGHIVRGETRPSGALLRPLLLTAALSATVGALATAMLDRLADPGAPPRLAPVVAQVPVAAVGRDPSVPDAGSVLFGREALPDEPVATF